jgi:hypothetical protein
MHYRLTSVVQRGRPATFAVLSANDRPSDGRRAKFFRGVVAWPNILIRSSLQSNGIVPLFAYGEMHTIRSARYKTVGNLVKYHPIT